METTLQIRPILTAIRVGATGFGVGDRLHWAMSSPYKIFPAEAMRAQENEGYDSNIYGFLKFTCEEQNLGLWVANWSCYASAD